MPHLVGEGPRHSYKFLCRHDKHAPISLSTITYRPQSVPQSAAEVTNSPGMDRINGFIPLGSCKLDLGKVLS